MNKTQQLFIRACRSLNPNRRLKSVYRRFYGRYDERTEDIAISEILTYLVHEVAPMSVIEYIKNMQSYKSFHEVAILCRKKDEPTPVEDPTYLTTGYVMKDRLRHIKKSELIKLGVTTPAKWRK